MHDVYNAKRGIMQLEQDEWREIEDFPKYLINPYGDVRHHDRYTSRRTGKTKQGFLTIVLYADDNNARYLRQVNALVARTFLTPKELYLRFPEQYYIPGQDYAMENPRYYLRDLREAGAVWHLDGNLMNVAADNLLWATKQEVSEWNAMHRSDYRYQLTHRVMNTSTNRTYDNAYECALDEGELESKIIWRVEVQGKMMGDRAKYQYLD